MLAAFANIFKIPELRNKVLITLGLVAVFRLGAHLPTPGIDGAALAELIRRLEASQGGSIFSMVSLFSGGALEQCTIFALGIMPYISASIIIQLLQVVIPRLEKIAREGDAGRKKINQYTRYSTVLLSVIQAFFISKALEHPERIARIFEGTVIVPHPGFLFTLTAVLTLTTGTLILMWLGEQITEKGIGNGISLIITGGIISRLPAAVQIAWQLFAPGNAQGKSPIYLILLFGLMVLVVVGIILVTQAERKIPIQRAQQIRGRKVFQAQNTYLPLRVNYAGVIPVIFASSLLLFPATVGAMIPDDHFFSFIKVMTNWLAPGEILHNFLYVILIIFFCYFWTATQFNPIQIADDMKRTGAFVPGIRPGKNTAEYLETIMVRITLAGAIFLAFIALFPSMVSDYIKIPYIVTQFLGGTGLLIMVGVMLDTMRQVESHLIMRHYDGFMSKTRLKGRF
ncbi:MAG: preprotein translocase subunit SecY [Candidatus Auribacterota bacterium]|jgi:preprotein translocase subunit SecY|nr:preprotein translocase subunit SecY [Candidatus Auribacterota bacterium]